MTKTPDEPLLSIKINVVVHDDDDANLGACTNNQLKWEYFFRI